MALEEVKILTIINLFMFLLLIVLVWFYSCGSRQNYLDEKEIEINRLMAELDLSGSVYCKQYDMKVLSGVYIKDIYDYPTNSICVKTKNDGGLKYYYLNENNVPLPYNDKVLKYQSSNKEIKQTDESDVITDWRESYIKSWRNEKEIEINRLMAELDLSGSVYCKQYDMKVLSGVYIKDIYDYPTNSICVKTKNDGGLEYYYLNENNVPLPYNDKVTW